MIFLELFLTFFKIGAVCFGGGYGMISLIREECLGNGWLGEDELLNMIAVSESTPGPIAVNIATFVGSSQGGVLGAFLATLGVILPAFIIILLIAAIIGNILKYRPVNAFLGGLRPAVAGLIIATAVTMILSTLFGVSHIGGGFRVDVGGIIIFGVLIAIALGWYALKKKRPSPIVMILVSACLGMVVYSIL